MMGFWPRGVIPLREKEFKELTEKAEKSDEYYRAMREFQERNSNQAHMIRDLKKKLEAVKTWVTNTKALCNDEVFPWFELLSLEKILDAEV